MLNEAGVVTSDHKALVRMEERFSDYGRLMKQSLDIRICSKQGVKGTVCQFESPDSQLNIEILLPSV